MPEGARFDPRKPFQPRYDTAMNAREVEHGVKSAGNPVGKTKVTVAGGGLRVRGLVQHRSSGEAANSPTKRHSPAPGKVGKVMGEFKRGALKSSSGQKVKSRDQAEAGMSKRKKGY